jgi:DNA-binding NarL/FixJ family response regulator
MIRTVVAEDNFLLREALRGLLSAQSEIELAGMAADLDQAIAMVDRLQPDLVLTDIRMPPTRTTEGLQLAEYCRRNLPATGVLVLSQYIEPSYVKTLLAAGTDRRGYLLKERVADEQELLQAIRTVAGGGAAIDPKVVQALVQGRARTDDTMGRLTPRERQVLACIATGRNNAAIAQELVLTGKAVEKHINSIFAKLGLSSDAEHANHPRVRAALMYLSAGIE